MKLTQQEIKQLIREELKSVLEEELPLEEGLLDKIKTVFSSNEPFEGDYGSFDENAQYDQGTYGSFLQMTGILGTLKKRNIETKKNIISAAAQTLMGGGDSKIGGILGMASAVAGIIGTGALAATGLGLAGASSAAIGLIKNFRKDPSLAQKYPILTAFKMDKRLVEIIDDKVEQDILQAYEKFFKEESRKNPEKKMKNINVFARDWLIANKDARTITAPGLPSPQ